MFFFGGGGLQKIRKHTYSYFNIDTENLYMAITMTCMYAALWSRVLDQRINFTNGS